MKTDMKKDSGKSHKQELRKRAEALLNKAPSTIKEVPSVDVKHLVEELRLHQVELEMQIEELRQSQMEFEEARDRYANLYDFAPVGYFTISAKGLVLESNLTGAAMLGVERKSLKGNRFSKFIARDERNAFYFHRQQLLETKKKRTCELKLKKKDGSEFHAHLESRLVDDSTADFGQFRTVVSNIDDRKRAEEGLRQSEEKYRNILENIREGYFEVDIAGNLTFFNDSVCEILGYSREALMGMNNKQYMDKENTGKTFKIFNKVYSTGNPVKEFYLEIIRQNGNRRCVETSVSLMKGSDGNPIGFRGIARDITERKLVEQEREMLESQLQQARKMEAIGTLAGGIAHDFNNLLMGIQGNVSLALLGMDFTHPDYKRLKNIENHTQSGIKLTGQLLGFARGGKYEIKPTNMTELIKKSSRMFGRTRKEIKIYRKYQKDIWTVEVDQGQIEQTLLNFYVNASQAMPGGGNIYLQTENIILDEDHGKPYDLEPGRYVKISLTDTGIGMDEETKGKIFDPFFTTKKMGSEKGIGLGLASAYGIIKNHGGMINVQSKKGEGTTFNIYLPASESEIIPERNLHEALLKGTETVLLVDDEEQITAIGEEILKMLGYTVLIARSGKEAIEIYKEKQGDIDMVLLDMIMPEIGGGETYDILKKINPDIKVLLSSGYSIDGQAKEILERGCDGFIQKPFKIEHFSQMVREILAK